MCCCRTTTEIIFHIIRLDIFTTGVFLHWLCCCGQYDIDFLSRIPPRNVGKSQTKLMETPRGIAGGFGRHQTATKIHENQFAKFCAILPRGKLLNYKLICSELFRSHSEWILLYCLISGYTNKHYSF